MTSNIQSVEVFDLSGKKVLEQNVSGSEVKLNASSLNKGLYLCLIKKESGNLTVKLVKE